jgi:hypothetical protein
MKSSPPPTAAPSLWAAAFAILWTLTPVLRWWHPYCDHQADGPGYFAWGFPLPWSEPTGVSSLEFTWQPLALVLDLVLVWIPLFLLFRWLIGRLFRGKAVRLRLAAVMGGVLFLVMVAWIGLWLAQSGIASWRLGAEGYFSYRPYPLAAAHGHHACS